MKSKRLKGKTAKGQSRFQSEASCSEASTLRVPPHHHHHHVVVSGKSEQKESFMRLQPRTNFSPLTLPSLPSFFVGFSLNGSPLRPITGDDYSARIVVPSSNRPGCDFPPHVNQAGAFRYRLKGEKTRLCTREPFSPGGGIVGLCASLFSHLRPAQKGEQRDGDVLEVSGVT